MAGWYCSGGTPSAPDICTTLCGDGVPVLPEEECDDQNLIDWDGCNMTCKLEAGWTCLHPYPAKTTCTEVCGDGRVVGAENCDDGGPIGSTTAPLGCQTGCKSLNYTGWYCQHNG